MPEEHLDAEVLAVWGNPAPQLADAARRLRKLWLVQLFSAGSDNAMRAGFGPGVVIASGRGLHDRPVAEHALALVLAAARGCTAPSRRSATTSGLPTSAACSRNRALVCSPRCGGPGDPLGASAASAGPWSLT